MKMLRLEEEEKKAEQFLWKKTTAKTRDCA